ncbi:dihydroxyacetone kinase phosphoryl donor subunit DhaM [uncultured Georgenia sp.]|uniref:dihydroxyacetone kinase phosphoryl donor subunit DhaM n=1 Tax=uncultured Georgenia sp. TaxID=378209 RepID=UPI00262708E8|nr:dihydroxyacetone kinase phosphoryl donor subunit DhaM [uncultured Georgenia sp.]HLV03076.1 dihydroxyacetone kinase phosphoryl donor subunit DhaM [Actinomycetaceae bacterium]
MTTAIVVVSHSAQLARGVCEVAAQMAPDVPLRAAGGTVDGRIGTSFDKVLTTVVELTEEPVDGVVVLTDLGSATMTAESVLEMVDDERVVLADAPLVEGAIAAAVAAQGGADPTAVRRAAEEAAASFPGAGAAGAEESGVGEDAVERVLELRNALGLHARPAAMLARVASGFDARIEVEGVDGTSVLALIALGLEGGARMRVRASGRQAEEVLDAISQIVADGFGEE